MKHQSFASIANFEGGIFLEHNFAWLTGIYYLHEAPPNTSSILIVKFSIFIQTSFFSFFLVSFLHKYFQSLRYKSTQSQDVKLRVIEICNNIMPFKGTNFYTTVFQKSFEIVNTNSTHCMTTYKKT